MNPQRLTLLLVVLAAVAGALAWVALRDDPGEGPPLPEAAADALIPGDPAELRILRIERPRYGQRVAFSLGGGEWRMIEPIPDQADQYAVGAALSILFGNDYRPPLDVYVAQTEEQLGLAEPDVSIELQWADGSTSWLRVGAQEPGGDFRVAQREEGLVRLPLASHRRLERAVDDWRSHRLQPWGVGLTEVRWEPAEGTPLLLRNQGRRWRLVEPREAALADPAHDQLLALLGARLVGMGREEFDFERDGRDPGLLTLRKGEEVLRLKLTSDLGILSDARPYSLSVDPLHLRFLGLPVETIVSPRLLDFDPEQVASIRLEHGEDEGEFRRAGADWVDREEEALGEAEASFLDALLRYGHGLERGEERPLPATAHAGRILYSISRRPREEGSTVLRWWLDEEGRVLVAAATSDRAYLSEINFEAGVADLFRTLR